MESTPQPAATVPPAAQTVSDAKIPAITSQPAQSASDRKITLGGLADAFEVLQEFANQPLDGVTAAKVVRLSRWARSHYVRYVGVRGQEAEKLGEKIAEGKYRIASEKMGEFNQAMAPTRAELVEIDPSLRLDVRQMGTVKITPIAIEILEPFLTGM